MKIHWPPKLYTGVLTLTITTVLLYLLSEVAAGSIGTIALFSINFVLLQIASYMTNDFRHTALVQFGYAAVLFGFAVTTHEQGVGTIFLALGTIASWLTFDIIEKVPNGWFLPTWDAPTQTSENEGRE